MEKETRQKLTNLDEIDSAIVDYVTNEPSISNTEIALRLGMARQTISGRRNSEAVQSVLKEIKENDIDRFMELRKQALERSELLMKSDNEQVAASICKEFLKSIVPTQIEIKNPDPINITVNGVKVE